ncbi:hypothetical protein QOT17_004240 [Balamuthia mandrillaris]
MQGPREEEGNKGTKRKFREGGTKRDEEDKVLTKMQRQTTCEPHTDLETTPPSLLSVASTTEPEEPSLDAIAESARKFCGQFLFSPWYFGGEEVEEVFQRIKICQQACLQQREFIALVQATMMEELCTINQDIDLFNASLFHGGNKYVNWIFNREVAKVWQDDQEAVSKEIQSRHEKLTKELSAPTFALDECHVLLSQPREAKALLFHSDYKNHDQNDVLQWQRHERFSLCSDTYPYPCETTLFSGFRWVLEEYLLKLAPHQTAIFASTFLSVWEPLMDENLYSREKPSIAKVILKHTLTSSNLIQVLMEMGEDTSKLNEDHPILSLWCGRPGLFFDFFLFEFLVLRKSVQASPLQDVLQQTHAKAEQHLYEKVLDPALRKLEKLDKLQMSNLSFGVTGKELCYFLVFSSRICGGNILCQGSSALSELVANGLVIVETFNHNHKSIGMIKEPMIERFLLVRATRKDAHAACDQFIAERMNTATGSNFGNEAEYAVANQILAFSGHSLRSLLTKWGCVAADKHIPEGFYVLAQRSAALNDLSVESTELLGDGSLLRVTRPRDRIILPGALFFASTDDVTLCLVSVQVKCVSNRLSAEDFDHAIHSLCRYPVCLLAFSTDSSRLSVFFLKVSISSFILQAAKVPRIHSSKSGKNLLKQTSRSPLFEC